MSAFHARGESVVAPSFSGRCSCAVRAGIRAYVRSLSRPASQAHEKLLVRGLVARFSRPTSGPDEQGPQLVQVSRSARCRRVEGPMLVRLARQARTDRAGSEARNRRHEFATLVEGANVREPCHRSRRAPSRCMTHQRGIRRVRAGSGARATWPHGVPATSVSNSRQSPMAGASAPFVRAALATSSREGDRRAADQLPPSAPRKNSVSRCSYSLVCRRIASVWPASATIHRPATSPWAATDAASSYAYLTLIR